MSGVRTYVILQNSDHPALPSGELQKLYHSEKSTTYSLKQTHWSYKTIVNPTNTRHVNKVISQHANNLLLILNQNFFLSKVLKYSYYEFEHCTGSTICVVVDWLVVSSCEGFSTEGLASALVREQELTVAGLQ